MPELHPQVAAMADAAALFEANTPEELAAMRDDYVQTAIRLGGALEPVERVEDVVIARAAGEPALAARAYWPRALEPVGALVWLHGGGWCIGDLEGFDRVCRSLCNAAAAVVVSVDYRLAPEHRYPAAVEDADLAVAWATGHGADQLGYERDRVAVGGDSAGGNLAAVAALHARDALRAGDLRGAPPAFIAVAGHDVLRDDGVAYARALEAAGVPVELREFDDMSHGFLRWGGVVDRARELIAELGAHAREALRT
jgi:acetyl esterase